MINRTFSSALALPVIFLSSNAVAVIEPAAMDAGPVRIIPMASIQTGYDDNILSASDNEQDDVITVLTPSVQLIAEDGVNAYRVAYRLSKGIYNDSSDDNYLDHDLSADAHLEFSHRSMLDLKAAYSKSHETRGTGLSAAGGIANAIDSPLEFDVKTAGFKYTYGGQDATGRVEVFADHLDREYTNFRSITESRDVTETTAGAVFYYQVAPKTSLLFEARNKDIDYDVDGGNSLDSNTWKYFIGATWESTAKTTGTVKLGRTERDFDSSARKDFSGTSWEASVRWLPRTYSTVDLTTGRIEKETNGNGDFIDNSFVSINWNHAWNDIMSTDLGIGFSSDDYEGAADERKDETTSLNLGLNYDFRRWLTFGLLYQYNDTDSNVANADYKKNVYLLTVNASL